MIVEIITTIILAFLGVSLIVKNILIKNNMQYHLKIQFCQTCFRVTL